ncbi:MAG TPA: ATP-binding protein [Verrucomicrobiae bacterium]|nr:ATP-binding protein [Verrucomicrobiae bacterium]
MRDRNHNHAETVNPDEPEQMLPPEAAIADDHRNPRRGQRPPPPEVGTLIRTTPRDELDSLVLHEDVTNDLLSGLRAIELREELDEVWNISEVEPQDGRCILNFFGDPGTGKTRAALAVARRLSKPLYQVDYAAIISKYLGDTAKHITLAFQMAESYDAVLFFDEADSLLSKRADMNESCATSINQNRNVLMQCLDRFNGVVIMTTNLFQNYDPAILRRIAKHIQFRLPDGEMRRRLFELHLPKRDRVEANWPEVARISKGLSGGDIKNVCLNSIYAGSMADNSADWKITQAILLAEIEKIKEAKRQHREGNVHRPPLGFCSRPDSGELD